MLKLAVTIALNDTDLHHCNISITFCPYVCGKNTFKILYEIISSFVLMHASDVIKLCL